MSAAETVQAEGLLARIDRLESLDQIRQLSAKYALSLDMRDFDAMANLFVEDVGVRGEPAPRVKPEGGGAAPPA